MLLMNSGGKELRGSYVLGCPTDWFTFIVDEVITINVTVITNESLHCVCVSEGEGSKRYLLHGATEQAPTHTHCHPHPTGPAPRTSSEV